MRARVLTFQPRRALELALAVAGTLLVTWVLLNSPWRFAFHGWDIDRFTVFPASVIFGTWLPILARRSTSSSGELRLEGRRLVLRGTFGDRSLGEVLGVDVAQGKRGASALFEVKRGLVAAAVDDPGAIEALAAEARAAGAEPIVRVPRAMTRAVLALRAASTLLALGYYLHVVLGAIGGSKAHYGLGAIGAGLALLVLHFIRKRPPLVLPLSPTDPTTTALAPDLLGDMSFAMQRHVGSHHRAKEAALASAPREAGPRIAERGEEPAAALQRLRRALNGAEDNAYRGAAAALRTNLERASSDSATSLSDRALAVRILAGGDRTEAKRRIGASADVASEEAAWLEEIALAETDDKAAAKIARRRPTFEG